MKRAAVVIVLVAVAFIGYRRFATDGAQARYEAFAEEILRQHWDAAAAMCDGLSSKDLEKLGSQERIGAGPPMFQTLFPSRFVVSSREKSPDGSVTLHATQTVLFNPVGVESAIRPAMFAKLKQVITLQKQSGEWKVTDFDNEFESMDSLSSR